MLASIVAALAVAAAPNVPPTPCSEPLYAGLDFLLGDWTVRTLAPDGSSIAGQAKFTRDEVGTCAIVERVEITVGTQTQTGLSLTAFDRPSASWRKSYVESGGSFLAMVGVPPVAPDTAWVFDLLKTSDMGGEARETWQRHDADHLTYRWQKRKTTADPWVDAAVLDYRRLR